MTVSFLDLLFSRTVSLWVPSTRRLGRGGLVAESLILALEQLRVAVQGRADDQLGARVLVNLVPWTRPQATSGWMYRGSVGDREERGAGPGVGVNV